MKAVKLFGQKDIRVVDVPIPEVGDDQLLLQTKAAAICGTDLRMIDNGYRNVSPETPLVLGHEISGVIHTVGKNVKGYSEGMRVAIAPNMGCGVCDTCTSGNTQLCSDYQAFGINLDGGFAEYVLITESAIKQGNVTILSNDIPFAHAAIMEPFSCVLNGQERAGVSYSDTVAIVGAGPIGLMHAMLAKSRGASRVMITDLNEDRINQYHDIDPAFIPIRTSELKERLFKLTDQKGVDVCITACPSARAQRDVLDYMAVNGRVLYFGGLPANKDNVSIPTNIIHYNQLSIYGTTRANLKQYRTIATMINRGCYDLQPLISATYSITDFMEALAYAKSGVGLKTIITFDAD